MGYEARLRNLPEIFTAKTCQSRDLSLTLVKPPSFWIGFPGCTATCRMLVGSVLGRWEAGVDRGSCHNAVRKEAPADDRGSSGARMAFQLQQIEGWGAATLYPSISQLYAGYRPHCARRPHFG